MPDPLPQPPDLDPTSLANPSLGRARRGFEPAEVNQLLGRAADALRAWQECDQGLRRRIEALEGELVEARKLDEGRIASVLGEETARIISAAREAAAEIRAKASDEVERLVKDAEESSKAAANALTTEAEALRAEAESMRADAAREYSSKVDEAQTRHDQLISEGQARHDELLAEAQTVHDQLLSEARARHDELVSTAEARREELVSTAQARHDELLTDAQDTHDRLVSEGQSTHDELVAAAEKILADRTSAADAEAERIRDDARSEGRAMVAEAKAVRDRILADLAERRRIARKQIEGAIAGRDNMIGVLREAGESMASIVAGLTDADAVARDHANHVAETLDDDTAEFLAGLDVEMIDPLGTIEGSEDSTASDSRSDAPVDEVVDETDGDEPMESPDPGVDVSDDLDGALTVDQDHPGEHAVVMDTEHSGTDDGDSDDGDSDDGDADRPVGNVGANDVGVDDAVAADSEASAAGEEEPMADVDDPPVTIGDDQGAGPSVEIQTDATVHDLFARIRAQGMDGDPDDEGLEDDGLDDEDLYGDPEDDDDESEDGSTLEDDAVVIDLSSSVAYDDEDLSSSVAHDDEPVADDTTPPAEVDELARVAGLLDIRDDVLVPVERQMLRTLRRLASDEQNEVLDRLRRVKRGRPDMDDVVPSADEMLRTFSDGVLADFSAAIRGGFDFWVRAGGSTEVVTFVVPADVRERLEAVVSGFVSVHRAHLERSMGQSEEAGSGSDELAAVIKAVYRDWRQSALSEMAGDLAIAGFSYGERTAAGPGVPWVWVVDNGGLPCADGEDNALAGAVLSDEEFPTGDRLPPAHTGCRCILVPADH